MLTNNQQAQYYDIVVICARKANDPRISFQRLLKVLDLLMTKVNLTTSKNINLELLRLAWKEFRKAN